MQPRISRAGRASVLIPIATLIAAAHAGTLTYGVDAGVAETDNVALAHTVKTDQTIAVTDFDVDYQQKSQRLDVDAKGDFSYLDYLQKAYHNELLGRFDGRADAALIPQRLTWVVLESFGQAAISPFTPTTPSNIENVNGFSTGPDLLLSIGGAGFANFNARATRTQYETTPFTNTRFSGSAAGGINLSALSSVSINADSERVLFENTLLNSDFERTSAFFRYALQGARTNLSADLGATAVGERDESMTGALARFKLARKLSASASLSLSVGRNIIDGGSSFSNLQAGATGVIGTASATNTSQNYTSSYGSVEWDYQRNRTTLSLSGRWERDDYATQRAFDRTLTTGEMRFQRLLTRAFSLGITGRVYKSDYANAAVTGTNGSPDNINSSVAAALTWRHGRALELKLAGEHTTYTTSPNDTGYRENRVFLTVGYRPLRDSPVGEAPGL